MRQLEYNQDCASSNVCGINNPELNTLEKKQYAKDLKQNILEIKELTKSIKYLQPKVSKKSQTKALPINVVSDMLCGSFDADNSTSSATKCKCGREKWEHPKPRN